MTRSHDATRVMCNTGHTCYGGDSGTIGRDHPANCGT